jgi:malonate decarboxylase epsilon subunit
MSSLLVFPGQGAQRPGMLQVVPADVLEQASDALLAELKGRL